MPTFAFPVAPQCLTALLLRCWNAPLPIYIFYGFGGRLDARLLSMHSRSTSELLRTL